MRLFNAAAVRRHRGRFNKAFTLLELIVVVVVIAIIAAIVIANNMQTTAEAQIRAGEQSLAAIARNADTLRAGVPRAPFAASDFDPTDNGVQFAYNQATSDPDTISVWLPGSGSDRTVGLAKLTNSGTCVYLYVDRGQRSFANSDDGICSGEFADDPTNAVDTDGPTITVSGVAGGAKVNGVVDLDILVTDTSGVNTVTADIDGTPITLTDNGDGTWSYSWDTTGLTGQHSLNVTADDVEGNTSTDTTTVTVEMPHIGYLVADTTSLTASEQALKDAMDTAGFDVTLVGDADHSTFDFDSVDGVLARAGSDLTSSALRQNLSNNSLVTFQGSLTDIGTCCLGGTFSGSYVTDAADHPVAEGFGYSIDIVDNSPGLSNHLYRATDSATRVFRYSFSYAGVIAGDNAARHVYIGAAETSGLNAEGAQLLSNALVWAAADVPEPPANFTVTRNIGTTADLTWDPTVTPSDSYRVGYREYGDTDWTEQSETGTSATITGLSDSTLYEFRVRGVNGIGKGRATQPVLPARPVAGTIMMSVADTNNLNTALEQPFYDRLIARGLTVNLVSHTNLATADLTATDLLVVPALDTSDTTNHPMSNIDTLTVPVLSLNGGTADEDLNLAEYHYSRTYTNLEAEYHGHPIIQYLEGNGTTWDYMHTGGRQAYLRGLAPGVSRIASCCYSSTGSSISVNSEATRMHFGGFRGDVLREEGWRSFDGSVTYMLQNTDLIATPQTPHVTIGNGQLALDWPDVPNADQYRIDYRDWDPGINQPLQTAGTTSNSEYTLSGLTNTKDYSVYITAIDAAGNESAPSPVTYATPTTTDAAMSSLSLAVAVEDDANPSQAETMFVSYLQARGANVTAVPAADVASHDFTSTDVLLLPPASSVTGSTVSALNVPVVVMDGNTMEGMFSTDGYTTYARDVQIHNSATSMASTASISPYTYHFEMHGVRTSQFDMPVGGTSAYTYLGGHWDNGRRVAYFGMQQPTMMRERGWTRVEAVIDWAADPGPFVLTDVTLSRPSTGALQTSWGTPPGPTPDSYELRYRPAGTSTWTDITGVTGTSHTITGLPDTTGYEVQARGVLGGNPATWSALQSIGSYGGGMTVAFNVEDDTSLHAYYEQPFVDRLNNLGYNVTLVSDADLPTWTPSGDVLVVRNAEWGTTAHPTYSNFDTIGMPVLSMQGGAAGPGDMGVISSTLYSFSGYSAGYIYNLTHPISDEYSTGRYQFYTDGTSMRVSRNLPADSEVFAQGPSPSYALGVTDDTEAHRQAYFGLVAGQKYTGTAGFLFDEAVYWTAN